jgi:hypothetical protein
MTYCVTPIEGFKANPSLEPAGNGNKESTWTDNTLTYDSTPPTSTISFPTNGGLYNATSYAAGCPTPGICGTASDDVGGSGVQRVDVAIQRTSDHHYWNGTDFTSTTVVWNLASGTTSWSYGFTPPDGTYTVQSRATDNVGNQETPGAGNTFSLDTTPPTVTINQAAGQADPTNTSPIHFTGIFSEPVTGFSGAGVDISGTAGGTKTVTVTGSGTTYDVAVSGMTDGTVVAAVKANAAQDGAGNGNTASTSTDNTVTYDGTPPTVTINQAGTQADPTNTSPIHFTVVFSESVADFATGDVTLAGTAGATTATVTGSGTTYTVAVSGMTSSGTVIATIAAGVAHDAGAEVQRGAKCWV